MTVQLMAYLQKYNRIERGEEAVILLVRPINLPMEAAGQRPY